MHFGSHLQLADLCTRLLFWIKICKQASILPMSLVENSLMILWEYSISKNVVSYWKKKILTYHTLNFISSLIYLLYLDLSWYKVYTMTVPVNDIGKTKDSKRSKTPVPQLFYSSDSVLDTVICIGKTLLIQQTGHTFLL